MEKENHIQGAIYYPDHRDYYISLERGTLEKIKNGDIIKSKIVYGSDRDIRNLAQNNYIYLGWVIMKEGQLCEKQKLHIQKKKFD